MIKASAYPMPRPRTSVSNVFSAVCRRTAAVLHDQPAKLDKLSRVPDRRNLMQGRKPDQILPARVEHLARKFENGFGTVICDDAERPLELSRATGCDELKSQVQRRSRLLCCGYHVVHRLPRIRVGMPKHMNARDGRQ